MVSFHSPSQSPATVLTHLYNSLAELTAIHAERTSVTFLSTATSTIIQLDTALELEQQVAARLVNLVPDITIERPEARRVLP